MPTIENGVVRVSYDDADPVRGFRLDSIEHLQIPGFVMRFSPELPFWQMELRIAQGADPLAGPVRPVCLDASGQASDAILRHRQRYSTSMRSPLRIEGSWILDNFEAPDLNNRAGIEVQFRMELADPAIAGVVPPDSVAFSFAVLGKRVPGAIGGIPELGAALRWFRCPRLRFQAPGGERTLHLKPYGEGVLYTNYYRRGVYDAATRSFRKSTRPWLGRSEFEIWPGPFGPSTNEVTYIHPSSHLSMGFLGWYDPSNLNNFEVGFRPHSHALGSHRTADPVAKTVTCRIIPEDPQRAPCGDCRTEGDVEVGHFPGVYTQPGGMFLDVKYLSDSPSRPAYPYYTLLSLFRGDWYVAAKRYKRWADRYASWTVAKKGIFLTKSQRFEDVVIMSGLDSRQEYSAERAVDYNAANARTVEDLIRDIGPDYLLNQRSDDRRRIGFYISAWPLSGRGGFAYAGLYRHPDDPQSGGQIEVANMIRRIEQDPRFGLFCIGYFGELAYAYQYRRRADDPAGAPPDVPADFSRIDFRNYGISASTNRYQGASVADVVTWHEKNSSQGSCLLPSIPAEDPGCRVIDTSIGVIPRDARDLTEYIATTSEFKRDFLLVTMKEMFATQLRGAYLDAVGSSVAVTSGMPNQDLLVGQSPFLEYLGDRFLVQLPGGAEESIRVPINDGSWYRDLIERFDHAASGSVQDDRMALFGEFPNETLVDRVSAFRAQIKRDYVFPYSIEAVPIPLWGSVYNEYITKYEPFFCVDVQQKRGLGGVGDERLPPLGFYSLGLARLLYTLCYHFGMLPNCMGATPPAYSVARYRQLIGARLQGFVLACYSRFVRQFKNLHQVWCALDAREFLIFGERLRDLQVTGVARIYPSERLEGAHLKFFSYMMQTEPGQAPAVVLASCWKVLRSQGPEWGVALINWTHYDDDLPKPTFRSGTPGFGATGSFTVRLDLEDMGVGSGVSELRIDEISARTDFVRRASALPPARFSPGSRHHLVRFPPIDALDCAFYIFKQ